MSFNISGPPTFGTIGGGDGPATKQLTSSASNPLNLQQQPVGLGVSQQQQTTTQISAPSLISAGGTNLSALQLHKTTAGPIDATKSQQTAAASLTTATTTTSALAAGGGTVGSVVNPSTPLTFTQLEDHINKWTLELEEQEKMFTMQATQINAWDSLLISNNEKIITLNEAVQKVKADQQNLEQELEFVATQHAELEESILPLEKELKNLPQVDVERTQTYLLVENLDTQLKQMSEDLKEVIDYLNDANKVQDSNDPIVQIGKILNSHMSSLQWIESCSSAISNKLEDFTKMHDSLRRDSERSFRLTYSKE